MRTASGTSTPWYNPVLIQEPQVGDGHFPNSRFRGLHSQKGIAVMPRVDSSLVERFLAGAKRLPSDQPDCSLLSRTKKTRSLCFFLPSFTFVLRRSHCGTGCIGQHGHKDPLASDPPSSTGVSCKHHLAWLLLLSLILYASTCVQRVWTCLRRPRAFDQLELVLTDHSKPANLCWARVGYCKACCYTCLTTDPSLQLAKKLKHALNL